jgi:hypothetical protein
MAVAKPPSLGIKNILLEVGVSTNLEKKFLLLKSPTEKNIKKQTSRKLIQSRQKSKN